MKNETKFQNRYRIPSNRLPGWDYSNEGIYFLTICTCHRECLFGEIVDHAMILNDYGLLVRREWLYSARLRSEIILGSYIVMPNHFHAIVHIVPDVGNAGNAGNARNIGNVGNVPNVHIVPNVETHGRASLQPTSPPTSPPALQPVSQPVSQPASPPALQPASPPVLPPSPPQPCPPLYRPPKSISSLMAGFKSAVTKQMNIIRETPGRKVWQANYYDHIIRNDKEYKRITDYIEMNPVCWSSDSLR